ncbi:MAG: hypothetical protein V7724_14255 [Sediminicola sp.]
MQNAVLVFGTKRKSGRNSGRTFYFQEGPQSRKAQLIVSRSLKAEGPFTTGNGLFIFGRNAKRSFGIWNKKKKRAQQRSDLLFSGGAAITKSAANRVAIT